MKIDNQNSLEEDGIISSVFPPMGFLRQKQILGDPKATPPIPAIIPVSHTHFWRKIKAKEWPQPIKISPNVTVWKAEEIRELVESLGQEGVAA